MTRLSHLSAWASGVSIVARREIRDQLRDWRILTPIIVLTLFFPLMMNFTAQRAVSFVARYGADIVGERLIPFLLMVVGFFPISISLVIALESFAGERERLSLEPLLATPLSDSQLYLGKMLASLISPLVASYLGITVYLVGLALRLGWHPPSQLLVQVLLLTTAQAIVMVSGAVVISSQTTSVRAANLLASFIIVPVSQLIIGESLVMFWGMYDVLWWIVIGLGLIAIVLARMGMHLFNREELLGREIDVLDLRWAGRVFWERFRGRAGSLAGWYRDLFRNTVRRSLPHMMVMVVALTVALSLGFYLSTQFTLPKDLFNTENFGLGLDERLNQLGFLTGRGFFLILFNNLRALALSSLLGAFSFGVLAVVLLMAPVGIVGYFAGNVALAGQNAVLFVVALVLPHAVLEMPAAVLAGASILRLGMATVSLPKGSTLGEGWLTALAEWARMGVGLVLPLLIGAALLEVFITPRIATRLLIGW